jgi:hypothetical protein
MKRKIPALGKSLFMDKQHLAMDAGLVQAQRFRVGWGPNWKLAHAGKAIIQDKGEFNLSITTHVTCMLNF